MTERLIQLWTRIGGYHPIEIIVELAMIWVVVWLIFRFLRGTRAARMFKGLGLVLILASLLILVLSRDNAFQRIQFLYRGFLGFAALALVIVFQPELRRALVRLGEARFFRGGPTQVQPIIEELIRTVTYLSKNKIGAIIAVERDVPLGGIIEAGTPVNADVTAELLQTIFWPGTALHDMGVVIRGGKLAAAGVQFPLYEGDDLGAELGSRHRAALGLSQEADCLVVVVSEETGTISLAERGELIRKLSPEALRSMLRHGLSASSQSTVAAVEEGLLLGDEEAGAPKPARPQPPAEKKPTEPPAETEPEPEASAERKPAPVGQPRPTMGERAPTDQTAS